MNQDTMNFGIISDEKIETLSLTCQQLPVDAAP
jgi:hypothetical protein